MDVQRRTVLATLAAAALPAIPGCATAPSGARSQLEENKNVVLRYKKSQGTPEEKSVAAETLAPGFKRTRAGFLHLAANARGQNFPSTGTNLRAAIPDRVDVIEDVIADGSTVGLLFRVTGTHLGNFYGIPATGRKVDVHEIAFFDLADGRITEAWFMADEAGLLRQLGAGLPARNDGALFAPPVTDAGEDGDAVVARLAAATPSIENRNKLMVARSKSSQPAPRAPGHKQKRLGLQHMREYGQRHGTAQFTPTRAFPGRNDRIVGLLAEGDKVWMRFNLRGTHRASFYGLAPTGRRVEMPEVGIMRLPDGAWTESWYFGDELGLLLQLGAPEMIAS